MSDRTGRTAEAIGESLLSQFDTFEFDDRNYPFITTRSQAMKVAKEIQQQKVTTGQEVLVFSTLVDSELEEIISATDACVISLYSAFIGTLENALATESSHEIGKPHEEYDDSHYNQRIDAIDYTMKNDDGVSTSKYKDADVILIGVSRSAKTPTCLYLALNFSIKAANYPLTDDDLDNDALPEFLTPYMDKIIGLTIKPDQLSAIRQQRRPKSDYASLRQCQKEIRRAEKMMTKAGLTVLDSTVMSIEEIAVNVVKIKQLLK